MLERLRLPEKPSPDWLLMKCVVPEKYPYSPHGRFIALRPPPPTNSSLASYFASKILAFKISPPLLMTFHGVGMHFFLNYTIHVTYFFFIF